MKKLFSFILSLIMALGVSTVTFADDTPQVYTDEPSIPIAKIYELVNDGVSPAETFDFTITKVGVTDSQYTKDTMPMITPNNYSITFGKGDANSESTTENEVTFVGCKKTATINLPTYNHVGIFTYEIKETPKNTAGVTYDGNSLFLKVTVIEQNGEKVRVTALHYKTENGSKTEGITNKYSAGSLAISKEVTGNMGETDRYFKVNVKLTAPEGKDVKSTITATGGKYTEAKVLSIGDNELEIKHDDTITINNIPYGVTYTVTESDYTGDGYDAAEYTYSDDDKTVDTAEDTVTITNNKGKEVDTGVIVDNLPYIVILGVVAVGMGVLFVKRRTANSNR
ncbi:MAG: hypothetical protein HUJ77_04370 [Clostridium sp.]|uniref:DUF7601 domain-containing protein n=1 Tax=Clostridium sp. TaxID=1506 RepID=UPI0025B9928B|nr:DUF5979 domain-containing protein [Clostridium sp.]MCF0147615.1 hypothetical protein [Clostridium sp.]